MSELRSAIESNDTQRITTASEALQQASYKLRSSSHERASQTSSRGAPEEGALLPNIRKNPQKTKA